MKLEHTLLINAATSAAVRYPAPANTHPVTGGAAINGIGRNGQHYADQVYAAGALYETNWQQVTDSRCTVEPRPSAVGGWTRDDAVARWTNAVWDRICPVPTRARTAQIWSRNPPVQTVPVVPAVGDIS